MHFTCSGLPPIFAASFVQYIWIWPNIWMGVTVPYFFTSWIWACLYLFKPWRWHIRFTYETWWQGIFIRVSFGMFAGMYLWLSLFIIAALVCYSILLKMLIIWSSILRILFFCVSLCMWSCACDLPTYTNKSTCYLDCFIQLLWSTTFFTFPTILFNPNYNRWS